MLDVNLSAELLRLENTNQSPLNGVLSGPEDTKTKTKSAQSWRCPPSPDTDTDLWSVAPRNAVVNNADHILSKEANTAFIRGDGSCDGTPLDVPAVITSSTGAGTATE